MTYPKVIKLLYIIHDAGADINHKDQDYELAPLIQTWSYMDLLPLCNALGKALSSFKYSRFRLSGDMYCISVSLAQLEILSNLDKLAKGTPAFTIVSV